MNNAKDTVPHEACSPRRAGDGGAVVPHEKRFCFVTGILAVVASVVCVYSVSLGHNFLFDEKAIIENNPCVANVSMVPDLLRHGFFCYEGKPETAWEQRYRPLTSLTFALDRAAWGLNPLGFNLTNTLIHLLVCMVLFSLLFKAYRSCVVALLTTLFYALHPVHVEAVTYIASRSDPLATLLMLLAVGCHWQSRIKTAALCYGLGLFAKESVIFLPAALFLADVCFIKPPPRQAILRMSPYAAVAAAFLIVRMVVALVPMPPGPDWPGALLRLLSMGWPTLEYLRSVVWPADFEFGRSVVFATSFREPKVLVSALVYAGLFGAWFLTRRHSAVFFGLGFFLLSLFPYLQWMSFDPVWAEHYLYAPLVGLVFMLGALIRSALGLRTRAAQALLLIAYGAFVLFLAHKTWTRNSLYNDPQAFYQRLAESDSPYAAHGLQFLGIQALERNDPAAAWALLNKSQALRPMPTTENLLGLSALRMGRHEEALKHFESAYAAEKDEGYRLNLGVTQMRMGDYDKAVSAFLAVQQRVPRYGRVYENLLAVYEESGAPRIGLDWGARGLEQLKEQENDSLRLLVKMAGVAYRCGFRDEMRGYMEEVLARNPNAFWYGDVARLLTGRLSAEAFDAKLKSVPAALREPGEIFLLRALVLRGDRSGIAAFFASHPLLMKQYEEGALPEPSLKREIEMARAVAGPESGADGASPK